MFGLRGSVRNRKRHYGTLAFYSPSKKGRDVGVLGAVFCSNAFQGLF